MKKIMTTRNTALEPNDDLTRANGRFGSSQVFLGLKAMFMAAMLLMSVVAMAQQQPTGVVVKGHVFGGGNEGPVLSDAEVSIAAGTVEKDVYGGGNLADVSGSVTVTMTGGTVNKDVYGGGALANTNIGNVTTGYGTSSETIPSTSTKTTTVNLQGGTIKGDAYGGGLGRIGVEGKEAVEADPEHGIEAQDAVPAIEEVKAKVYGDVLVNLGDADETSATAFYITDINTDETDKEGNPIKVVNSGRIFGCNNLNGSPQGNVTVNVYKTVEGNKKRTIDDPKGSGKAKRTGVTPSYEVAAVYGGGNLSNYVPVSTEKKTKVNILTCDVSVESVYGGGNAAAVPETDVLVFGAYEIRYVFGGGNGKDKYTLDGGTNWIDNGGANVNGDTRVLLQGGYIHEAYGGSNEKGTVRGQANLNTDIGGYCELDVVKLVGAGKNADIDGDAILVLGCMPEAKVDEIYGGADNANVNGNVELTITSGNFGKVFGGNNRGGLIKGHIILNIEETGCRPINIDELYLGGNEAAYSIYGYYDSGDIDQETGKPIFLPRTSETDTHTAVDNPSNEDGKHPFPYANPILNVISFTRIGEVYGGGLGAPATIYGSPTVNINQAYGKAYEGTAPNQTYTATATELGTIGNVYGGGNEAEIVGNPTVNISTKTTVDFITNPEHLGTFTKNATSGKYENVPVAGVNITGDVFGGGNEANVLGNTQVNICAVNSDDPTTTDVVEFSSVTPGAAGVNIGGNVFGGGKGVADNFFCNKAMVGEDGAGADADKYPAGYPDGRTNVIIGNGTVEGTVYGGGKIGRVEMNTTVTIGLQEETSEPVIKGDVFGAGKGLETHGYAALVRGNPTVTIQGHAKVERNVYGGGEIASVARYNLVKAADLEDDDFVAAHPGLGVGMPYALAKINGVNTGNCTVIVRGNAEVGTEQDGGNVFGAGQGILPYYDNSNEDKSKRSRRMMAYNSNTYNESNTNWEFADDAHQNVWEYFPTEAKYIEFVQTQGLSSQTNVTISGNATVRGSLYGGSENGIVQFDAHVNVTGGTIGVGQKGGVTFGNVFGAGKGYVDAARPENLLAGIVRGNTEVTITDGSILHNVYGGGAYGSVGTITPGSVTYVPGQTSVSNMPVSWARKTESETSYDTGTATIKITGGTIGVDGHEDGMVFGSSRGDVGAPGSILDHQAWVYETHVIIGDSEHPGNTTTPLIKGSIYGSGENGHVFKNTVVDIYGGTIGLTEVQSTDPEGYIGADYLYRGNVYGGGCGTDMYDSNNDGVNDSYNALSGCVLGNATININGGHVVHNVYGAGAMGSVGRTDINNNVPTTTGGKTMITITGGRIGDDGVGDGNVYGAARGGEDISDDLAHVRETEVTIQYSTTPNADNDGRTEQLIAGSVFGGGESGTVQENVVVNVEGGLILHDVYGGGALANTQTSNWDATNSTWTDATNKSSVNTTLVNLKGGRIIGDLYGGGLGRKADTQAEPAVTAVEAKVYGDVTVTTTGGKAARVFGCNNLNGAPQGRVAVNINGTDDITGTNYDYAIGNVYGGGNQAVYSYVDAANPLTVTMAGGNVNNIFGGGLSADVAGSIAVNVTGGQVINDVYGGGALANTNTANWNQGNDPLVKYEAVPSDELNVGTTSVAGYYLRSGDTYTLITSMLKAAAGTTYYKKKVGGDWAVTHPYKTTVDLTGGIVGNVYGGGLGQMGAGVHYTQDECNSYNIVENIPGLIASGTQLTAEQATAVNAALGLTGDAVYSAENTLSQTHADAYNAKLEGYRTTASWKVHPSDDTGAVRANVYGDVKVTINDPAILADRLNISTADVEDLASTGGAGVAFTQRTSKFTIGSSTTEHTTNVTGHVFGCNNINGTPTGDVAVYVYSTRQLNDIGEIISGHIPTEIGNENEKYEIQGVYGGGNLADYLPAVNKKTIVRIDGCNITSIKKVFGGGNSALVPATDVVIYGSYAIGYAFGGGNGGDYIKINDVWQDNEGAIVIGTASIACHGGKVGSVFGGSDAKGVCGGTHIDTEARGSCPLKITRIYGAGNEADVNGNVNTILSGCTSNQVEFVHGGSYNAHITGNVTLTITSGILQNVYGGNDARGSIGGDITVNIEETEVCEKPIIIQNLVGGGNNAPYPGTNRAGVELTRHGKITVNVMSATRIDNVYGGCFNAQANADTEVNINMLKGNMAGRSNVSIPKRYYVNNKETIPNITHSGPDGTDNILCTIADKIGTVGNVYGGGKEGKVAGNTTVNIGTATTVNVMARDESGHILDTSGQQISYTSGQNMGDVAIKLDPKDVLGAHITGNVYGGGELADVTGNTFVYICYKLKDAPETGYECLNFTGEGKEDIKIAGNVFGGGKGADDTFTCEKAMIGTDGAGVDANFNDKPDYTDGNTSVIIANGTVGTLDANDKLVEGTGNVYGGGEIGRVEKNTSVTIGVGDGSATTPTSTPVIYGDVFGAGKGVETHGYSALVRGNPSVTVQGNAKVRGSVYGGGEIGSVARYKVVDGSPVALANNTSGNCVVTVKGYAEIGPDNMQMNKAGGGAPDFSGHVFGAGKGVLPKVYSYEGNDRPRRMLAAAQIATISSSSTYSYSGEKHDNIWEAFGRDADYHAFIETLALSSQTTVTIGGHAFVKGSVYGGSEDGIVQYDTQVTIQEHCQIGCGANTTNRYENAQFIDPTTTTVTDENALAECDHWLYGKATNDEDKYKTYDKFAGTSGYTSYASTTGDDGHTFYGNVFGGGSGYFPYAAGKWHWEAGAVRGNTNVNITGGHILTNVYGGNELTNVGKGVSDTGHGKCTITMSNGTVGVPRTLSQIADHPVTCYIFGGGKGDPRVLFNKQTNVNDVEINITGGIIYGSVFGGGEDGHVMRNVTMTIGNTDGSGPTIGTWGTSYVDGNVFGGGRGFSGDAYTAGNVAGSIVLKIKGGTMLGSIYGGGRLGSVGYGLYESTETAGNDKYGEMQEDGYGDYYLKNGEYTRDAISGFKRGHVEIEISGGTIGNTYEYEYNPSSTDNMPYTTYEDAVINNNSTIKKLVHTKGGNVFAGGMGRRMQLDGVTPITAVDWWRLGAVKSTKLTISGDAIIKSNVYGGCEFGEVLGYHTTNEKNWGTEIVITGGTIGTPIGTGETAYDFGAVYGGGMGEVYVPTSGENSGAMDKKIGGDVKYNTSVSMSVGAVKGSVYGGGELGSVGTVTNDLEEKDTNGKYKYKHIYSDATSGSEAENLANAKTFYDFGLSWPYKFVYDNTTGLASVNITGSAQVSNYVFGGGKGRIDIRGSQTDNITTHRYDEALIANVRETQVTIGTTGSPYVRTVYGGGEDGHVYENASVTIHNGTIERSVFGGGKGEGTYKATLWEPKSGATDDVNQHQEKSSAEAVHSWTAGKVYGNTSVTMNDGSVGWFIYGGGNKASVGKGNYSGGKDDYSTVGYGELPSENGNLWTTTSTAESETKDDAYHFLNSGIATVNIFGGTVGTGSGTDENGIPHGSVFGGSRGQAAASCKRSPRYMYVPDFFLGYVNKAIINIGKKSDDFTGDNAAAEYAAYEGPTIYGSVYGGGQDGHVRNSTEVKIYKGKVQGLTSDEMGRSGNVFGAGSGIGTYMDGAVKKVNNSSGSVTCTTLVEVNGGTIKGSVYGGGALASVGPPKTGGANQTYDEKNTSSGNWESYSYSQVNIKGGSIGGNVFGASRGPGDSYLATNPNFDTTDGKYDATKYATDIWSNVHVSGGKIGYDSNDAVVADGGSVYGGGETGQVKCGVTVNITGGEIAKDVYGGGALANTNTGNLKQDKDTKQWIWTDTANRTAKYTTTVNLLGGTIHGDAYGGGLGRKEYGISGQNGYVAPVEALVYGDVKVNLNGVEAVDYDESIHGATTEPVYGGRQVKDTNKGAVVTRVFGCNNLNGSPQGAVRVHVFATQNAAANQIINTEANGDTPAVTDAKEIGRYDVQAVYGGANLAAYTPMGPDAVPGTDTDINNLTTDYKNTKQRTEVIIDGCSRTSIKQVYGGGNAAPVPASYLEVNGTYEIDEVFGGGNGADKYKLTHKLADDNIVEIWYENPGANVGYETYAHYVTDGTQGTGAEATPYKAIKNTNPDSSTPAARKTNYGYGKSGIGGVATTAIKGGKINNVYGGSNKEGNISTTALSMYERMNDDCPIAVEQSYGGSKNADIDAEIVTKSQCAQGVKELFGGSKNADVNSDVVLTITNGSSFERVFGGNNTSGAIAGSITINIEEGGCEPIKIKELYAGGYLAPYSIYGYEMKQGGGYATEEIDYGGTIGKLNQCKPLTKTTFPQYQNRLQTQIDSRRNELNALGENDPNRSQYEAEIVALEAQLAAFPKQDPRINVISATKIDTIYGGGYRALVVGSPHINVNMTEGKVEVENKGTEQSPSWKDINGNVYTTGITSVTTGEGETAKTTYYAPLPIGTIGNIYGGGNLADIDGDTYVEIGTGKWVTSWDAQGNPIWETTDASGNTYTSSQTSAAVTYTQKECNEYNAENVASYIRSTTSFTDKVSDINTALELTGEAAYTAKDVNYTEVAAAYNATLTGFKTTADVKTPAVLYTAEDAEVIAGTKQVGDVKTPAVYYTRAECNDINKELTGYIAIGATLTAKQAVAVNEALETSYAASSVISTEDAAAYNATLNGYRTTADVKTDAVWTWKDASNETVDQPTSVRRAAMITGNVFGGGKGKADTFTCEKAMVGVDGDGVAHPDGGTHVTIANGTVGTLEEGKLKAGTGNVYGGGEIARVEKNTMVTIGVEENDAPVIYGDVFGAGKGVETHGYSALVRGNPSVIIQGKSQVRGSVYGGGEIASVARYKVVNGSPVALANKTSGNCKVIIRGDAEIGPDNMTMTAEGGPDDTGHVFGAGKGVLPGVYSYADNAHRPRRMLANNQIKAGMTTVPVENDPNNSWQYFVNDEEYHAFIETLALSSKTDVTIGGNAFVKGSVYGGSLSGIVQYDTHVTIEGDCQIGQGKEITTRYKDYSGGNIFASNTPPVKSGSGSDAVYYDLECASWEYDKTEGAPYDPFATTAGAYDYTGDYSIIPTTLQRDSSDEGKPIATDGHTYYGNVFGGGSGIIPYAPGLWHRAAGVVRGNTVVDITGGHILTSVYGGNEHTDVGIYSEDSNGEPIVPVSGGLCTINFGGTATLGVPRTLNQIANHPVTCYLFGAGKGDQRIFFNTWTNIREAEVNITGGRIYGSVFGGGEDGHVLEDVTLNISGNAMIGTTGTSYVDGNVFGAGRGFSGEALTAGSVGGNVEVNIKGGTMLGSIYGGGRLASVGIGFNKVNSSQYGQFTDGDSHGNVTVNISGGIIGNANATGEGAEHSGNVFGGSMGRLKSLNDVDYLPLWPQLGQVKNTTVNIWQEDNNMPTVINGSVYGGGELGTVRDNATIVVGKKSKNDTGGTTRPTICHDIFGGGYGSDIDDTTASVSAKDDQNVTHTFIYTPLKWAGCVGQGTEVNIFDGWVKRHVYGGGEMASVGILNYEVEEVSSVTTQDVVVSHDETAGTYTKYKYIVKNDNVDNSFALSWPYQTQYVDGYEGATHITVTGGRLGDEAIESDNGDIYGGGKGIVGDRYDMAFCANVGSTEITINYPEENEARPENYNEQDGGKYKYDCVAGAVYGGGENGHVMGNTDVKLINGLVGHSLYGGGSGKGQYEVQLSDWGYDDNGQVETFNTTHPATIYSITAGKVYGNTNVTMSGGYVIRNVYGGGTLGSVGKGNYTGGANDYSIGGFGETILGALWNTDDDGNVVTTSWQTPKGSGGNTDFLGSGIATVTITGGTVGYINPSDISKSMKDGLPYGNVFGGCRGEAAPNVPTSLSPRYKYCPEFFMGYVNESQVTIGDEDGGPTILGSVYGGGQDGHVRRDTHVIINDGEIGIPYNTEYINKLKAAIKGSDTNITDTNAAAQASDMDNVQWLFRGNVYGSGSGIGTYTDTSGEHNSTSSGSVTGHTLVEVMGGTIYRNVYGGGSLSSIGPPPVKVNDAPPYNDPCLYSRNQVNIKSKIGHDDSFTAGYGGHVFGASRGEISLGSSFASSLQTRVNIMNGAHILGNVFGGGDNGVVKKDAEVFIGEKKVETPEP